MYEITHEIKKVNWKGNDQELIQSSSISNSQYKRDMKAPNSEQHDRQAEGSQGELIGWDEPASVRACVHTFKHKYLWDQ